VRRGVRIKVGDFIAVDHRPADDGGDFKLKKNVWRLRTKVNGVRTKLILDTRSGRLKLNVKKANAGLLRAGGPEYVVCTLEVGTTLLEDAVVFDERGGGSSLKWRSLARGAALPPPPPPPTGEPTGRGSMVFEILARGERSLVEEPTVMSATNDADWQAMYDLAIFPGFNRRPDVDFKQDMVIGIFKGLVSQIRQQEVELLNVTEVGGQMHISWRARNLCTQFSCSTGGLGGQCEDFAPFLLVRVRRVSTPVVSDQAPAFYVDCP